MTLTIESTATLGKGLTIKREKDEEREGERVVAKLRFTDCYVTREQIDWIAGRAEGWARDSLFDELGAPLVLMGLDMLGREFTASVVLSDDRSEMHVAGAALSGINLLLDKSGALCSGLLTWEVAGDETSDIETLLGQTVSVKLNLSDGGQRDMLA